MTTLSPQVSINVKFSPSFWTRLACAIAGHSWKKQWVMGPELPDRRMLIAEPVCNRCGKFKNFPIYWSDYMKNQGYFYPIDY